MSEAKYYTITDDNGLRGWAAELPDGRQRFKRADDDGAPVPYEHMATSVPAFVALHQTYLYSWGATGTLRCEPATLGPGQFYPRIQRRFPTESWATIVPPGRTAISPPMIERHTREYQSGVVASRRLFDQLERVFQTIEPHEGNANTFGHELRHLLMLACAEVESAMKSVLKANQVAPLKKQVAPDRPSRYEMKDYRQLIQPMRLAEWRVELCSYPDFPPISPFANWPKKTPPNWWDAHNATKHDRELELARATLRATIDAVAALYILLASQFGAGTLEATSGSVVPFRLTAEGLPRWEPNEYYMPPDLNEPATDWTPVHLAV